MEFLDRIFYHNTIQTWLTALAAGAGTLIALFLVRRVVVSRLTRLSQHTSNMWDDVVAYSLSRTRWWFLAALALQVVELSIEVTAPVTARLRATAGIAILLQIGVWASSGLRFAIDRYRSRAMEGNRSEATSMSAVGYVGQVVIWSAVILLSLDNLGVNVTALIAGLGVGGVAAALALQKILGDLFASLAIVFDKPFVLGDFVIVGDLLGTVENIGLKTTRIRSLWGELLVFSNADLLDSRIRNYGKMRERRVSFTLGVTYQTPRQRLEEIPGLIRQAIEDQPDLRFDRAHFFKYGDFSLDFEIVYYVLSPDYNLYMDRQQAINLAIHRAFEERGIEFAYPTQTVFVTRTAA